MPKRSNDAFLRGVGSVVDIGGTNSRVGKRTPPMRGSLAGDQAKIIRDYNAAVRKLTAEMRDQRRTLAAATNERRKYLSAIRGYNAAIRKYNAEIKRQADLAVKRHNDALRNQQLDAIKQRTAAIQRQTAAIANPQSDSIDQDDETTEDGAGRKKP